MQSPMITTMPELTPAQGDFVHPTAVRSAYSALRVLQSAAGYYVGTEFQEFDADGKVVWREPGSRDSVGYFPTEAAAAQELRQMEGGDLSEARFHP